MTQKLRKEKQGQEAENNVGEQRQEGQKQRQEKKKTKQWKGSAGQDVVTREENFTQQSDKPLYLYYYNSKHNNSNSSLNTHAQRRRRSILTNITCVTNFHKPQQLHVSTCVHLAHIPESSYVYTCTELQFAAAISPDVGRLAT